MTYTLSEYESKQLLAEHGVAVPPERLAASREEAVRAAAELGHPVAAKLCGRGIAHKSERNLVHLDLRDDDAVGRAAEELLGARRESEREARVLIQPMARGRREVIAGLVRDEQFGPCVMVGLGGIFAEALQDVAFAVAPLLPGDAAGLIDALEHRKILDAFRGEPAADLAELGRILESLGRIGMEREDVVSIDVNPLVLDEGRPVVVDALVELR